MGLSFPYPKIGPVTRPVGQGCIGCVNSSQELSIVTGRKFKHGRNGYVFHKCRCQVCSKAESDYTKKYKEKEAQKKRWLQPGFKHGTNGYLLGCRCEVCVKAESDAKKSRRLKNGDHIRALERANLSLHAEAHRTRTKLYYKEHPEKNREHTQRYKERHPDRYAARVRRYQQTHAAEIREHHRIYQNERRKTDIVYKFNRSVRNRVTCAIARGYKKTSAVKLIGCPTEELREKLAVLFKPGMDWGNYGEWHVDHIIPCAAFDLTREDHQVACFNWRNLQPMWRKENKSKSDFIPPGFDVEAFVSDFMKEASV